MRIGESVSVQRGFALIAILALAALISAFLIASALNFTSAGISNEREDRSMKALRQAKAALIAYAASEQWQLYQIPGTYFQPGALPCPDQDDDGDIDCIGSNLASMIGRLPFKTLGIDDLRDASGERLWYALSHDFRKLQCTAPATPVGCTTINSDTLGQLTVTGMAPATQVVAILFAPGAALDLRAIGGPLQDRVAGHNNPTNYLEEFDVISNPVNYVFASKAPSTDTFNDRLLIITQADLMAAVEPVVAARIEGDVKPLLQDYFTKWGSYPFAMTFVSPTVAQSDYLGTSSQTMGLLPVTNTATFTWQNPAVTQIPGGTGSSTVTSWSCSITSSVICTINYSGGSDDRPDIRLEVFLANASMAFADTPSSATATEALVMEKGGGGSPTTFNPPPYGWWSMVGSFTPTLTFVARAGGGALTYTGRLQNAGNMNNQAKITVPLPAAPGYLPRLTNPSTTNPNIAWFLLNQWYRQTYYAMSPGFAPGGVPSGNPAACSPLPATPSCLTVNNLPAPKDNKSAILVFAGRALNGSARPSGILANYLEGQNSTPTDYIYEHRAGTPTAINDRVVVVSP